MKRLIKSYTRRDILKAGAVSALAINFFPSRVFGANARIAVAGIGAGGKGTADIKGSAAAGADIVALCDVDPRRGAGSFKKYPKAKRFTDFRVMLDKFGKSIDACTISTPDHTHAVATMLAMGMGKHCYTQKPLTHDIWEARQLVKMAAKTKLSTQMGNQAHAGEPIRRVVELVRAGVIGNVTEAHIWTNRPVWPQGIDKRLPKAPVPANVDWDLWLGPAPFREYGEGYLPFKWRGWWDFGTGALGDMACHLMDMAWWSLDLGVPTHVEAKHGGNTKESPPHWAVIDYQFPARGKRPPVKLVWYDGKKDGVQNAPSKELTGGMEMVKGGKRQGKFGTMLIGDKGRLFFNRFVSNWMVTGRDPEEVKQIEATTPKSIPRVKSNYTEWLDAAAGEGHAPLSRFQTAGPYTEVVLLGNLAIRANEPVEWSPKKGEAKSDKANRFVRREYRKGWGW
jgi:predicted dehydrogenase